MLAGWAVFAGHPWCSEVGPLPVSILPSCALHIGFACSLPCSCSSRQTCTRGATCLKPACRRGSPGLCLPPDGALPSCLPDTPVPLPACDSWPGDSWSCASCPPHLSCFPVCPAAAARADYAESEKLIAEQLTGLQRDAAWTKSYMVSALLLSKECMQVGGWLAGWVQCGQQACPYNIALALGLSPSRCYVPYPLAWLQTLQWLALPCPQTPSSHPVCCPLPPPSLLRQPLQTSVVLLGNTKQPFPQTYHVHAVCPPLLPPCPVNRCRPLLCLWATPSSRCQASRGAAHCWLRVTVSSRTTWTWQQACLR